jgi:hypothetical protein
MCLLHFTTRIKEDGILQIGTSYHDFHLMQMLYQLYCQPPEIPNEDCYHVSLVALVLGRDTARQKQDD